MFGLGGWEIAILVIAGLMLFGPNKLPQVMRQAGKIMREIKKASSEFQYSIERELEDDKYARQHRRAKKRRKKMAEAGLDPDAPSPAKTAGAAEGNGGAGAPPEGAVPSTPPSAPAAPVAAAPETPSPAGETATTKTGS